MYNIYYSANAKIDAKKLSKSKYRDKFKELIEIIIADPFKNPPPYEKLIGLVNTYSRRINIQHRLLYQILEQEKSIKIIRMWTHYGDN